MFIDYRDINNYYNDTQELSDYHGRDYVESINLLQYDDVDEHTLELLKQY